MANLLSKRFEELTTEAQRIVASKRREYDDYDNKMVDRIDYTLVLGWKVKAKNLLSKACGEDSIHLQQFNLSEHSSYLSDLANLERMMAVFQAAREDFDGGYLASVHDLIRAEVFDSELEQATELLKSGYAIAAAVVAGIVLETAIRDLCTRNQIQHGKLDKMNADLTKAGVYNGIVQKRITHLAAVRNSAAHGNDAEFKTYDVKAMIDEVEQFLATHFS